LTILVIVGMMRDAHSFTSQMGIGAESDCLLGLLNKIFRFRGRLKKREIRSGWNIHQCYFSYDFLVTVSVKVSIFTF